MRGRHGATHGVAGRLSAAPTFREALRFWVKLGFVSFGGPAGQIAIMHRELVERYHWISERRFLHALNYCMVLPGPEAQQLATYIGWLLHGTRGGIAAGALFVLPSLAILIALSWIYVSYGQVPAIAAVLYGVKPAVVAIVLAAAWRIGARTLRNNALWAIAVAAFVALFAAAVPFPAVILVAAGLGILGGRMAPALFRLPAHAATGASAAPSIIDDDTPTPEHARLNLMRVKRIAWIFIWIWAAALAALVLAFGWDGALTQMGWFFTKAALLTFGGAYAVLPYVLQGAVEHYGWLTAPQMMDGLALGETTPGPLIMTPPLTAITAAVVGVIVNLAVFFAWHVLWHASGAGRFDVAAATIALVATAALVSKRVGVIPVIAASGLAGLTLWAAGFAIA